MQERGEDDLELNFQGPFLNEKKPGSSRVFFERIA